MNDFLNKAEKKFGKYAIHNLSLYIIVAYIIGYVLSFTGTLSFLRLDPYLICQGQVWRIITWIIVPPSSFGIFTVIMLFFYYSLGKNLEMTWGAFRYNVYIFSGFLFTLVGAFIAYFILSASYPPQFAFLAGGTIAEMVSTSYVNMSIFLMFAAIYPDMQVLFYFIIPIKVKWMGYLYLGFAVADVALSTMYSNNHILALIIKSTILVCSLLNFFIFFLASRNLKQYSYAERKRRQEFRDAFNNWGNASSTGNSSAARGQREYTGRFSRSGNQNNSGQSVNINGISKHRCAICGRTELDDPDLEFRFCSKCNGNYEYCNEHLFSHLHK